MNEVTRVLVVDDNVDIQRDFAKVLAAPASDGELDALQAALFGATAAAAAVPAAPPRDLVCVGGGAEGLATCRQAVAEGRPFTLAFVDMRMPGGWDGLRTIRELWQVAPDLDVVICTAYSDHDLDAVAQQLGVPERLLVLKKPFDGVEVRQFVAAAAARRRVAAFAATAQAAAVGSLSLPPDG